MHLSNIIKAQPEQENFALFLLKYAKVNQNVFMQKLFP